MGLPPSDFTFRLRDGLHGLVYYDRPWPSAYPLKATIKGVYEPTLPVSAQDQRVMLDWRSECEYQALLAQMEKRPNEAFSIPPHLALAFSQRQPRLKPKQIPRTDPWGRRQFTFDQSLLITYPIL